MSDTRVTNLDVTRMFADVFHSNTVFAKNMNAEYEKNFGSQLGFEGQKIGPTLQIRNPIKTKSRTGWAMSTPDVAEDYVNLTIDTPLGNDLKFSDADMHTTIDDFEKRYVEVPAKQTASDVDADCAKTMFNNSANCIAGSAFAVPTTTDIYLGAAQYIKEALVPHGSMLKVAVSPYMERKIVGGLQGQYNPQANISKMYEEGIMSQAAGLEWYMSQINPSLTTGSVTATTPAVGTFSTSANTSLPYTGATSAGTWKAGQTITIAGLYDVNYETKTALSKLKQFVITTDLTATNTTGTLTVSPGIVFSTTDPKQNCYIAGGTINGQTIVIGAVDQTTSIPTSASTTYQRGLVWYDKAFAFASVPLQVPEYIKGASVAVDNFNFRFLRGYDIINARYISRLDIFYGKATIRPTWACQILTV